MNRLPETVHDERAFFNAAIRMHDEILLAAPSAVAEETNYPFQGHELWDSYFVGQALSCLPRPRRKILLFARANPLMLTALRETGAEVVDYAATPALSLKSLLPKRWRSAEGRMVDIARSGRIGGADTVVMDTMINEIADPLGVLRSFANLVGPEGAVICVLRLSTEGRHDYHSELGFVLPSREDVLALHADGFEVELVAKTSRESDHDAWPGYKIVGLLVRPRS
ncbi:hypothetical protein SGCZBJ_24760 [Caulobacter zeae]|uniref:Uncharacterized protein n=1 Tax=Caulobacter zeae TaxID=2055137 RepID=A0A2N5CYH4_9CAUL|nr:hypothetical protein [Caulobacter zeae]PLR18851.1 hypothetical protein SGCZBJ_24760 [Caulobacter zeae]